MTNFKKAQIVNQFDGENAQCSQSVSLDTKDLNGWLTVKHSAYEISLSVENWRQLKNLVDATLDEAGILIKKAECVEVWERSKQHLTLGKVYDVIKTKKNEFLIYDDKGKKRRFFKENSQFKLS